MLATGDAVPFVTLKNIGQLYYIDLRVVSRNIDNLDLGKVQQVSCPKSEGDFAIPAILFITLRKVVDGSRITYTPRKPRSSRLWD
jgi:hypothetical protein